MSRRSLPRRATPALARPPPWRQIAGECLEGRLGSEGVTVIEACAHFAQILHDLAQGELLLDELCGLCVAIFRYLRRIGEGGVCPRQCNADLLLERAILAHQDAILFAQRRIVVSEPLTSLTLGREFF
eukprot:scaffold24759_cov26-Tisochrysis_lutea.AAC.1